MNSRHCLLLVLLFCFSGAQAQYFKVSGKITNSKLEPLALASIQVKGSVKGTISKEDGTYELQLEEGSYDLVFSMLGYKTLRSPLAICSPIATSAFVVPDKADKTTITGSVSLVTSVTIWCMRSGLPTLVPPNFITFIT